MAGNYPDSPSWRMAYDRDGTVVVAIINGAHTQATPAQVAALNDEGPSDWSPLGTSTLRGGDVGYLVALFPEARDVDAYYLTSLHPLGPSSVVAEVSANSTTGMDGAWSTISSAGYFRGDGVNPEFRERVTSTTATAVRAIRFRVNGSAMGVRFEFSALHLYGEPVPGANPHRLELWHPTRDERLPPAALDWGDSPRGSSADRTFRVKNLSPTSTGNDIRVAMEALTDASPSVPGQHLLSYNGGTFLAQVNIGTLAPGAISAPITLRRTLATNAQLGVWAMRVFAEALTWS